MEDDSDSDTNRNWHARFNPQKIIKGLEHLK